MIIHNNKTELFISKAKKEEADKDASKDQTKVESKDKDKEKSTVEDYALHEALNLLKGISIIKK